MSTAAADKAFVRARQNSDISPLDAIEITAKNKTGSLEVQYLGGEASVVGTPSGQAPFKHACFNFVGGTVPDDTDYPDTIAPIGSKYCRLIISSEAVVGAEEYLKAAAGQWVLVAGDQVGELVADVEVSTAEVLALNATPKTLVAAPGAGKIIVLQSAQLFLDYNSAAYADVAAGDDLAIKYTDGSGAQVGVCEATGFIDQTNDEHRLIQSADAVAVEPVANAALVLHMLTGEVTTGDSPLKVRVRYKIVDLQT